MRAWVVWLVLGACSGTTDGPSSGSDTDDTDSDDADTDAADTGRDTGTPDSDEPPCQGPLVDTGGPMPRTWAGVAAVAGATCVSTSVCEPELGASRVVSWSECEGSRSGYYDAAGALVSVHVYDDIPTCSEHQFTTWFGEIVRGCTSEASIATESAACASPDAMPTPAAGCVLPGPPTPRVHDLTGWTDVVRMGQAYCVGLATCTIGDRQLDMVYHDQDCHDGGVDVWDHATGVLVANLDPFTSSSTCGVGPHWVGEDLSACLPVVFTASAACGLVAAP